MYYIIEKRSWHEKTHGPFHTLCETLRQKKMLFSLVKTKNTTLNVVSEMKNRIIMFSWE